MKIRDDFILQEVADDYIVVPVGENSNKLHGVIRLNASGAFLWEKMSQKDISKEELVDKMTLEYGIDKALMQKDVSLFIEKIEKMGCLE